jgi:thiamine biosynthesis lipoprotein
LPAGVHRFSHEAMAAVFEVLVAGEDATYARQAADAAFAEVDRLEAALSRFDPASDVSQINLLKAGESVRVGLAAFECLADAARVWAETRGAFDVTAGALVDCWKAKDGSARQPTDSELADARARTGMNLVAMSEKEHAIGVTRGGMGIDLGGIGKGYALDRMKTILQDWSIPRALVHGGESTVLALGSPEGEAGWRVAVGSVRSPAGVVGAIHLEDRALSGSSASAGHPHIIDPRTGRPASGKAGAWALASSAARADALSTAFFVMAPDEIEKFCRRNLGVSAMIVLDVEGKGERIRFGEWPMQRTKEAPE